MKASQCKIAFTIIAFLMAALVNADMANKNNESAQLSAEVSITEKGVVNVQLKNISNKTLTFQWLGNKNSLGWNFLFQSMTNEDISFRPLNKNIMKAKYANRALNLEPDKTYSIDFNFNDKVWLFKKCVKGSIENKSKNEEQLPPGRYILNITLADSQNGLSVALPYSKE